MTADEGRTLVHLARRSLEAAFAKERAPVPPEPWLHEPGAVFVTLRQYPGGELRGCVGSIEACQPLGEAVVAMARAAAFRDGRFAGLERAELSAIRVDVSVLSPLTPLRALDEADAWTQLERTRPGVVLTYGSRSGVLLPQVWDSVSSAPEFLQHLKVKAGLPADFWSPRVTLETFTCEHFAEVP